MAKPKQPHRRPFKKRRRPSAGLRLMPWQQVATLYNRQSGETLHRNRIRQIGQAAEAKLRRALADFAPVPSTEVAK